MRAPNAPARGLHYEDVEPQQVLRSSARTVTETDLVQFAMLSGDWNPIHMDEVTAASSAFGRRVVHGMCGMTIMGGLMYAAGWFADTMVALLGFSDVRFVAPIFVGDTLHCRMTIVDRRLTGSGRGLVVRRLELVNQDDVVVQESTSQVLLKKREV